MLHYQMFGQNFRGRVAIGYDRDGSVRTNGHLLLVQVLPRSSAWMAPTWRKTDSPPINCFR